MKWILMFTLAACSAVAALRAQVSETRTVPQPRIASIAPVDSTTSAEPDQPQQPSAIDTSLGGALLLDVGDVLEIRVFDTPELSGKLRVDSHGNISLPVGGAIAVKGLAPEQVQTAIEDRFRQQNILRDPHVEVFVLEYATQRVTVMGEVKMPGVYPLGGRRGVLDLISVAGGPTSTASKTALLTRKNASGQVITVDLSSASDNLPQPQVEPGDRIVVTRAGIVYVVGDVGRPGGYLMEHRNNLTVLQALALAQGLNKTARQDAKLIRSTPTGRTTTDVPLKKVFANQVADPELQNDDILYVPVSSAKQWTEKGLTSVLQMAVGVVIYGRY